MSSDQALEHVPTSLPAAAAAAPMQRATIMKSYLAEQTEQRGLIAEYIEKHMIDGTDFGKVPGVDKPCLLKPGAEKLTDLFLCTAEYHVEDKIEDWDRGLFHYRIRCDIVSRETRVVFAQGVGSANTREAKHRWRFAKRTCPKCKSDAALLESRPKAGQRAKEGGEGYFCWTKRGGCGATFPANDPAIVGQVLGKVENDDPYTLANTVLKMAKKRAHVDAAIALSRCSDIFTQDVEEEGGTAAPAAAVNPAAVPPIQLLIQQIKGAPKEDFASLAIDMALLGRVWRETCQQHGVPTSPTKSPTGAPPADQAPPPSDEDRHPEQEGS